MAQQPRIIRDYDTVLQEDVRASKYNRCFYCKVSVGGKHEDDCVIRKCAGWYYVAIRENETGEVRIYRHDMELDDIQLFMWMEDNYACDCNRYIFFQQANGLGRGDDPHWVAAGGEQACGHTRYSALYAELPDGRRVELEKLQTESVLP